MAGIFAARARSAGKSARTRARLMDAATEVFARRGIEGTPVNEIAQAAAVANGTFYKISRPGGFSKVIRGEISRQRIC